MGLNIDCSPVPQARQAAQEAQQEDKKRSRKERREIRPGLFPEDSDTVSTASSRPSLVDDML